MRPHHLAILAAAGLALACGDSGPTPFDALNERFGIDPDSGGGSAIQVSVLALTRDSTFRPVANAQVVFIRLGEVPPDSVPDSLPPPPPPDSTPPTDSLTTIVFRLDSIPPDTTPPPPPPPFSCGRDGQPVARGKTDQAGLISVTGIRSGLYDILVEPPRGLGLERGGFCGLALRPGQSAQVSVTLIK